MTVVLAHRGASAVRPGNTIEAFLEARRLGADGVELDVRLSADGAAVVHHDPSVPGVGPVAQVGVADLPPSVPLLGEALAACAGMIVDVEIKNLAHEPDWDPAEWLVRVVLAELADARGRIQALVSSFSPATLEAVRHADATVATGWLTLPGLEVSSMLDTAAALGCSAVHPHRDAVTPSLVDEAHGAGLAVNTWTVDDRRTIQGLARSGVDGVITNRPEVAREVLSGDP